MDDLRIRLGVTLVLIAALVTGCFNPSVTIDRRSAIEQQLTRTAIWRAIEVQAIHKDALEGRWRVRVLAPEERDADWIQAALELRLSRLGVEIAPPDDAETNVVVAGVVYAGIDIDNFYVGVPIPGGGGQALSFYQSITERGRAEIFLSFRKPDGSPIGTTNPERREAHYKDIYALTIIGPIAMTDLEIETSPRLTELGADTWHQAGQVAGDWIFPLSPGSKGEREEKEEDD